MSKFCARCGTENKDEYSFCKKCGTPLSYGRKAENPMDYQPAFEEFEGISTRDWEDAVGNNSSKILKKFTNMKLANSKVSWCWPVAILSFFFGLFGAAIWFFYRKMYKVAIICLAIGIAISVGKFFIIKEPFNEYFKNSLSLSQEMVEKAVSEETPKQVYEGIFEDYANFTEQFTETPEMRYYSLIQTAERYISAVALGAFSMCIYKKHLMKKINKLKQTALDEVSYKFALTHSLGTSGGMAVLGVFALIVLSNITAVLGIISYFR